MIAEMHAGYTPVKSLISEITLLWFMKENIMSYMRNMTLKSQKRN